MAFSFLSRFRIRSDKEAEFIELARAMEALAPSEPGMFAVYESFTDEDADKAHIAYPHNQPLIERMIACMDGSYSRELLFDLEPAAEA